MNQRISLFFRAHFVVRRRRFRVGERRHSFSSSLYLLTWWWDLVVGLGGGTWWWDLTVSSRANAEKGQNEFSSAEDEYDRINYCTINQNVTG
jgi:hypothetical protein